MDRESLIVAAIAAVVYSKSLDRNKRRRVVVGPLHFSSSAKDK
jgi:hypothetical protein